MGKISYYEENMPHLVQETVCLKCLYRWLDVRPEWTFLRQLECPGCGETGYVIATGEIIDDSEE